MAILAFLRCLLVFLCCIASSSDAKTVLLHPEWSIGRPLGQKELAAGLFSPERPNGRRWGQQEQAADEHSPVFVRPQDGLRQADKIVKLPGQPRRVDFNQYSGYVTVDPKAGRELFYYFAESPRNSSTNPLVLWLNGGPGCSSFGYGAMMELGPFRVNADGKTLFRNQFSWTEVANVIFLESPVGVGFSYSKTSTEVGDRVTAKDAYSFLLNWLERFPQYKNRDFFIAGESYAGHYVPQLAYTILRQNENTNYTTINLRGIAIGNPLIDDRTFIVGRVDYLWSHAIISDETYRGIHAYCDFANGNISSKCSSFVENADFELGDIDLYNIYAPVCLNPTLKNASSDPVHKVDPCSARYIRSYLNTPEVQTALHAKPTNWSSCSVLNWTDSAITILPIIQDLVAHRTRVWIFSGDLDAVAPITSTKYALNGLKLPIVSAWRPWYSNEEVGGYVVGYKGVALVTVRGAGHMVPTDQPMRSLTMISSFLQGHLPPRSAPF